MVLAVNVPVVAVPRGLPLEPIDPLVEVRVMLFAVIGPVPEIAPELVIKLTVCIVELPRVPLTVIPFEPSELFTVRLVKPVPMPNV